MHYKIIRTEEEINAVLAIGKAWSDEHPTSFFGDNNAERYKDVEFLFKGAIAGHSISQLEDYVHDWVELFEWEGGEKFNCTEAIAWLQSDDVPVPYSKGGD